MKYKVTFRDIDAASVAYDGLKKRYGRTDHRLLAGIHRNRFEVEVPNRRALDDLEGIVKGLRPKIRNKRLDRRYRVDELGE